jgi:hypothetical protein
MPAQKDILILVTVKYFSVVLLYTERALKKGLVFLHVNYNKYQEYIYACTGRYLYFSYYEIFLCSPALRREGLEEKD